MDNNILVKEYKKISKYKHLEIENGILELSLCQQLGLTEKWTDKNINKIRRSLNLCKIEITCGKYYQ